MGCLCLARPSVSVGGMGGLHACKDCPRRAGRGYFRPATANNTAITHERVSSSGRLCTSAPSSRERGGAELALAAIRFPGVGLERHHRGWRCRLGCSAVFPGLTRPCRSPSGAAHYRPSALSGGASPRRFGVRPPPRRLG